MLDWFADAYALFPVKMLSESVHKQNTNFKKIYAIDNGMINAVHAGRLGNEGRLLENLVFLALRRRCPDIHYVKTRGGYEVDFHSGEEGLVQVAWSVEEEATRRRELRALEQAMEELGLRESVLISAERSETLATPSGTIRLVPAWEWFLSDSDSQL
jgi:predicted AAA+ superfamily ATPase